MREENNKKVYIKKISMYLKLEEESFKQEKKQAIKGNSQ